MSIQDRGEKFREIDEQYEQLARRRDAGEISASQFDAERKRLMVLDGEGRWWAKSAATGEWRRFDGKVWVADAPPGYETPENEGRDEASPAASGSAATETSDEASEGGGEARPGASLWRPVGVAVVLLVLLLVGGGYMLTRGTTLASGGGGMGAGDGTLAVPDLTGFSSVEEAREEAGEDFTVEEDEVESAEPVGTVVSQSPAAGERASENSTIAVDVSRGVRVPDVEGEDRDDALRTLEDAGFGFGERSEESTTEDDGNVVGQRPEGGEYAEAGATVEISVGEAPPPETNGGGDVSGGGGGDGDSGAESTLVGVPDVIGDYVEDAERTLSEAGFDSEVEFVEDDAEAGVVVWTDPEPDTPADPAATTVVLGVSSGPPPPTTPPDAGSPESPPEGQYEECC